MQSSSMRLEKIVFICQLIDDINYKVNLHIKMSKFKYINIVMHIMFVSKRQIFIWLIMLITIISKKITILNILRNNATEINCQK